MWHLAASKISINLPFLKWNDFLSYLWYDKKIIFDPVKNERLKTEILQAARCHVLWLY